MINNGPFHCKTAQSDKLILENGTLEYLCTIFFLLLSPSNSFPLLRPQGFPNIIVKYTLHPTSKYSFLASSQSTEKNIRAMLKKHVQLQWDSADWKWDQYSLTSFPKSDPSLFIKFIGSSYSTSFPEKQCHFIFI